MPDKIENTALNEWVFNTDTIREALHILMKHGIHVAAGSKLGKTIIFAKNHKHAEKIYEVFGKEYPNYPTDFCRVIDNKVSYAQSLIDEFSDPQKMPQIAVSVDMLDTGIDIPECVNLVFFKKVMSKSKFWQMIGRGTRLCPGLHDGKDKENFYIFDFCNNFSFFRLGGKGRETQTIASVQERIFNLNFEMCYKMQEVGYQTDFFIEYRKNLVDELCHKVQELNRDNFAVKQHLKHIEYYSRVMSYAVLTYENLLQVREEVSPLIEPYKDEISALRFDSMIYAIELAILSDKPYNRFQTELLKKVKAIAGISTIPEITAKRELIQRILTSDFVARMGIAEWEEVRKELRALMKYIPDNDRALYTTGFDDSVIDIQWMKSELESDDLQSYKAKASHYIHEHQNELVILKLKTNKPLTGSDVDKLQKILWEEVGSKLEYEQECGNKPLGVFVREITGLDMNAAKEAFSDYLNEVTLDSRQIYFANQIIEYVVQNGILQDKSVLQESPFSDQGSFADIFDTKQFFELIQVIDSINANALSA